jgi:hypothetical protein
MKYKEEIEKLESNHQKTEILKETIHQVEGAEYVVMIQARIGRTTLTKIVSKHRVRKKYMRLQF